MPGCTFMIVFNQYKFTQIPNGISPLSLHVQCLFFCQHSSDRALWAVRSSTDPEKTIPFSFLGLIFILSFRTLDNHKNTSVYRRTVAGICN